VTAAVPHLAAASVGVVAVVVVAATVLLVSAFVAARQADQQPVPDAAGDSGETDR
jgi:hypothetical protein